MDIGNVCAIPKASAYYHAPIDATSCSSYSNFHVDQVVVQPFIQEISPSATWLPGQRFPHPYSTAKVYSFMHSLYCRVFLLVNSTISTDVIPYFAAVYAAHGVPDCIIIVG